MKPKERRDRLFKKSRPNVRPIELMKQGQIGKDMAILWAAYQQNTFTDHIPDNLTQEQFTEFWLDMASRYNAGWMIEDRNPSFADETVPVGMMMAYHNGWELEPHFEGFAWATPRNKLRSVVGFLQMMRYDREVGVVNVHSLKKDKRFFKHVAKYGVLNYLGLIPHGDARGDRHIFYVRGRKQ